MMGFPHVTVMIDRHGKPRYRYRRTGRRTVYLPGKPGSPEFASAYAMAADGSSSKVEVGKAKVQPGTLNALAVSIYASAEWAALGKQTQVTYRGIIERLRRDYGAFAYRALNRDRILKMRDKKRDAPTAANNLIKVLRWMLNFALDRELVTANPCIGIKPLKVESEGFHTWTEAEVAVFEGRWPVGTRERIAFDLLLWTVQRSGDVRQMGRQHLKGGRLEFTQEKTGAELSLPILPALAASLANVPANQMLFVQTEAGVPFTAKGFGNWFSAACRAAGLSGCSAHGLRKAGCTRLANHGATEAEIMAWSGHETTKEVQRYTRKRDRARLADQAGDKLTGPKQEQTLDNQRTG